MRPRTIEQCFWFTCLAAALWMAGYCLAALVLTTIIAVEVAWCKRHELRWASPSPELLNLDAEVYQ